MEQLAKHVAHSRLQHADETGMRLGGKLHWIHVNSTRFLTYLAWHQKRGRVALEAIGIWPRFAGRAMHDRWKSYDYYQCEHSVCAAHLVRELTFLSEHDQQEWAGEMKDLLLAMHTAAQEWRERGAHCVPSSERDQWIAQYFEILAHGYTALPPLQVQMSPSSKKGRPKQSAAKNLLDDLLRRAEQVLAFLDDLSIPFTNNQAERDLRMIKVQQKIAGTFRSEAGATAFCRIRSYLSTMRKQGQAMLHSLSCLCWSPSSHRLVYWVVTIKRDKVLKAILTAKPAVLSTSHCMSAIQHNIRGIASRLSETASTTLSNPRGETPVTIPNTEVKLFSSDDILRVVLRENRKKRPILLQRFFIRKEPSKQT
jgi:Transposase IS66 family